MEERKWNLDALYSGYDTQNYKDDIKRLEQLVAKLNTFADGLSHENELETLKAILTQQSELAVLA